MVSVFRALFLAISLPILISLTLFLIPYLFYASYSIGIPNATPTDLFPLSTFELMNQQQSVCDMDTSTHCCIYIGPIIGKTTSTESRFLVELTTDINLGIILTPISSPTSTSNNNNNQNSSQPLQTSIPIKAKTPTIVEFDSLDPDTAYTISFTNCVHPLTAQPEGGNGLIKTLPLFWTDQIKPQIAVVSCNSINIRNRDRKILDQTVKPANFNLATFLQSSDGQKQEFLKNPAVLSYLAQITDMWTSLYLQTNKLHYLFHLGDQVYQDSKHDGEEHNQFLVSQRLVFKYLEDLWDYKQAHNAGKLALAEEIKHNRLPADTPDISLINQIYIQRFTSVDDAFTKWVQPHHRVSQIIPISIRNTIYDIYKKQYIKTYALASTRYTMSRVANLFIWDDHDVFDDSNDCPADTDTLSLRRLIFDIGLATYLPYQHALNLDNHQKMRTQSSFIPLPPLHELSYRANLPGIGLELDGITIQAFSMTYDSNVIAIPEPNAPLLSVVTNGMHHFHLLSDGLCFVFIDTRSARHPGGFNPSAFETYSQDPSHEANPYLLLGAQQWTDLEDFLFIHSMNSTVSDQNNPNTNGPSQCSALLVANSMPVQFMQSSPNHLVALFHDDMYGHWSSLEFEKEQVRLFRLFTNWREQQQSQNAHEKAQLLYLGGDVHSIGYTSLYPHSYTDSSLSDAYLLTKQTHPSSKNITNAQKHTLHDSFLEPFHSLTVSPIQQEGLDAMWLYSLVGFQHSYPLISNNNDVLPIAHNGLVHTLLNSYSKVMMYSEYYLAQVLPEPLFRLIMGVVSFINKSVSQIAGQCLVGFQYLASLLTQQPQRHQYTSSGYRILPTPSRRSSSSSSNNNDTTTQAVVRRDDSYYFGYKHYSWINTPGYAVITIHFPPTQTVPPSQQLLPAKHVCIESQVFALARPLEQNLFAQLYAYHLHKADTHTSKYHGNNHFQGKNGNTDGNKKPLHLLMPSLWSEYPKHNTTGFGC